MDPGELEQVRRAIENLKEIKKADREVQAMMSEEQFAAEVNRKMTERGLSREEAEILVKHERGLLGRGQLTFAPPAQSPLVKAFEEAAAERIKEVLFPKGNGGEDKGKGPDLAQTLKLAKERGVQSLLLPDGTEIALNPGDSFGDELLQETLKWVKAKVPSLFKVEGGPEGGLGKELTASQNPAIVRLGLEFRAKEEEIKAAEGIAQSKSEAMVAIATLAATMISPEGYAKVKGMLDLLRLGVAKGGGKGETPPPDETPAVGDKFVSMVCLNTECNHIQVIQRGTSKYACEKCGVENEVDWE